MEREFWLERWQRGQTGFHRDAVHPALTRHWATLAVPPSAHVFVPLCGKSPDLVWLWRRGHAVTGVELSPIAVRDFFAEQGLEPQVDEVEGLRRWQVTPPAQPPLTVFEGDLFALTPELTGRLDAVYDRASLIAFPPARQPDYVAAVCALATAPTLLVTVDYPPREMDGPPFPVDDAAVRGLYGATFAVDCLEAEDRIGEEHRFRSRGVTRFVERVYRLRPLAG